MKKRVKSSRQRKRRKKHKKLWRRGGHIGKKSEREIKGVEE